MEHIPVLLDEVLTVFAPLPNQRYIDATLGDGGHTSALLQSIQPHGSVLGLDQDPQQVAVAREKLAKFGERAVIVQARFSDIKAVAQAHQFTGVNGILFDLGFSSRQLGTKTYGLTFDDDDALLDMRLAENIPYSAADFLNRANEREIADTLYLYGDRHNSRTLARKIMQYRKRKPFTVAYDLKEALGLWKPSALAPIFQALRIYVNQEYDQITQALPDAISLLVPGGTLAVITFHSGEDRLVKRLFQQHRELLQVAKQIITPSFVEIKRNPRARSAKLRYAVKVEREGHGSNQLHP